MKRLPFLTLFVYFFSFYTAIVAVHAFLIMLYACNPFNSSFIFDLVLLRN